MKLCLFVHKKSAFTFSAENVIYRYGITVYNKRQYTMSHIRDSIGKNKIIGNNSSALGVKFRKNYMDDAS